MKIRKGFVSNSSSSSFCLLGCYLKRADKDRIAKNIEVPKVEYWGCSKCGKSSWSKPAFCEKCGGKMQTMEKDGEPDLYDYFEDLGLTYHGEEDVVGFDIEGKTPDQIVELHKKLVGILGEGKYKVLSGEYAC